MKDKLDVHKSYMTTYRMYKDSERELRFPLAVAVSSQNGDRGTAGEPVARAEVGERDLPKEFTFKTLCDWIRHELEEELHRRWKIKANGVGVPASRATAAG